ncbi:MAG: hypothetical protein QME32_06150 [Endomicrobiia bacterium]|nr:hypothetical protein [Endomicrobiia bacterium]
MDEKKIEKITPTELGVWMVCRKKWLFDYKRRQARYKAERQGTSAHPSPPSEKPAGSK